MYKNLQSKIDKTLNKYTMIITEISQIDSIAKEILTSNKNIITVDMYDYLSAKNNSSSLCVVKVEIPDISTENLVEFRKELEEVCNKNVSHLILVVCDNDMGHNDNPLTPDKMRLILRPTDEKLDDPKVVWGVCGNTRGKGFTLLVILGYR